MSGKTLTEILAERQKRGSAGPSAEPVETKVVTSSTEVVTAPVTLPASLPATVIPTPPPTAPATMQASEPPAEVVRPPSTRGATGLSTGPASRYEPLDATHTSAESQVYSVMYRETISRGITDGHFPTRDLMRLTGIRGDKTVRRAIAGLKEKLSILVLRELQGSPDGPLYRVRKPQDILSARRAAGIWIDLRTKRILREPPEFDESQIRRPPTGVPTGPVTDLATGLPAGQGTGVESTRVTPVNSAALHESRKSDDDELLSALREIAPAAPSAEHHQAAREIGSMVAAEIRRARDRAKEPPSSPRYAVECIRRALEPAARTPRRGREVPSAGPAEPVDPTALGQALAAEFRKGRPAATDEEIAAEVAAELARRDTGQR